MGEFMKQFFPAAFLQGEEGPSTVTGATSLEGRGLDNALTVTEMVWENIGHSPPPDT